MPLPPRSDQTIGVSALVRAALGVVFLLVVLQLLWAARLLVLTAFLGILFGLSAARATDLICAKVRVKRSVAAAGVVLGVLGFLVLLFAWTGPTLFQQSEDLRTKLPESVEKLEVWIGERQPQLLDAIAPEDTLGGSRLFRAIETNAPAVTDFAFGILQSTVIVAAGVVLVVFLALYIAINPTVYRNGILLLVPIARRDRVSELLNALSHALRTWFVTQLLAMLVIGVVTTLILAILGVRAALPLGILAGLFEFIPNVGPMLAAIPAVMMGFVDSPRLALFVAIAYWAIQFLENNLLIPYLMKEQLDLPPALTLVAQLAMAYVFGFLGLFVAIPLLATAVVVIRAFVVEDDLPMLPTVEMKAPGAKSEAAQIPGVTEDLRE